MRAWSAADGFRAVRTFIISIIIIISSSSSSSSSTTTTTTTTMIVISMFGLVCFCYAIACLYLHSCLCVVRLYLYICMYLYKCSYLCLYIICVYLHLLVCSAPSGPRRGRGRAAARPVVSMNVIILSCTIVSIIIHISINHTSVINQYWYY